MDYEFTNAEKPEDWPVNAREEDLELISKATDEFDKNPNYITKERLISLFSTYDLNQTAATGKYRITDYEVATINYLFTWGLARMLPSLRCYLYNLVGQTARMHKMYSWIASTIDEKETIRIKAYEDGLILPLRLYYFAYQAFNVDKDKPFADKIIEVVSGMKDTLLNISHKDLTEENKKASLSELELDERKRESLLELSSSYSTMLNDLSGFHGNRKEAIWKFDRDELFKLFKLEAELIDLTEQEPSERPLRGVLMIQISNYILKSRHDYNEDYICKYVSSDAAESGYSNHEIWMRRVEDLNDEREGKVIKELFDDRAWIKADWVGKIDFTPERRYFVSSFAKSINNSDMKDRYGEAVFGYKNDRIGDLISPLHEVTLRRYSDDESLPKTIKRTVFSQVTAYDVLYDIDEAKEELNYLFKVIDLFSMNDKEKNSFLNEIIQYWLLSLKDKDPWEKERERRYVLFLYDDYDYKEMVIDDGFLKLKTSLLLLPDFLIGDHPKKDGVRKQVESKRKALSYRPYMYCHSCLNGDYDAGTGIETVTECPICGSKDIEIIVPGKT